MVVCYLCELCVHVYIAWLGVCVHRGIIALFGSGDYRRQSYGICGICHILPIRHYQQKVNVVICHQ